jgi:hypothetical protein
VPAMLAAPVEHSKHHHGFAFDAVEQFVGETPGEAFGESRGSRSGAEGEPFPVGPAPRPPPRENHHPARDVALLTSSAPRQGPVRRRRGWRRANSPAGRGADPLQDLTPRTPALPILLKRCQLPVQQGLLCRIRRRALQERALLELPEPLQNLTTVFHLQPRQLRQDLALAHGRKLHAGVARRKQRKRRACADVRHAGLGVQPVSVRAHPANHLKRVGVYHPRRTRQIYHVGPGCTGPAARDWPRGSRPALPKTTSP